MLGDDLRELLGDAIPRERVGQALADDYIPSIASGRVIDLGCGAGDSVDQFRNVNPSVDWMGVDIERSPEVAARRRTDARSWCSTASACPSSDDSFDAVYCKQVLEHVRDPEPARRRGRAGAAAGRPLRRLDVAARAVPLVSTWNYTPYGLKLLVERAGMTLEEVRPGIDSLALIVNRGVGMRCVHPALVGARVTAEPGQSAGSDERAGWTRFR